MKVDNKEVLFSVDLGKPTLIKEFEMAERGGFFNRFPDNIEIWMSNSANEVGVDSNDAEWEIKAGEAGWVKVAASGIQPNSPISIPGSEFYRYMRVRVLSVPGGNAPVNIMEMYVRGVTQ